MESMAGFAKTSVWFRRKRSARSQEFENALRKEGLNLERNPAVPEGIATKADLWRIVSMAVLLCQTKGLN
jgi:hypothetical protein